MKIYSYITMCEKTGIMLYCYKHDQGVMVMSDKVPHNINVGCFPVTNGKHPSQCCDWEDVGTFKIKNNGTVSLVGPEKQWYDDNNACWCEDDFLDNLYDKNMNTLQIEKQRGIVVHCYTHDSDTFILGNTIPKKLSCFCCKNVNIDPCFTCDWEDTDTFILKKNVVHRNGFQRHINELDVYDESLNRIKV